MKLSKADRERVRMMFGGKCAYCGCELPEKGWHCDHVEAIFRGWHQASSRHPDKDQLSNIFPSCSPCNLWKSVNPIEVFRSAIAHQVKAARACSRNFRMAERFGLVVETNAPVVFWFERYQQAPPASEKEGR